MKNKMIRVISVLFVLLFIINSSFISLYAISYTNDVKTVSDSILLVNMDEEQVVFEKDADSRRYPASTTKIMTYIIAVENIPDLDNTRVPIKEEVLNTLLGTGSSLANLFNHIGETMTVIDLLYSMMVPSGNDASIVLADYVGEGDISKFVDLMNKKAEELGCKDTHFENPEGLHHENHYTTARDLYLITKYALTLPRFAEICNTATYYCEGDEYPLITTNYLIDKARGGDYYYRYANGIKTGTTNEAGRCLVTTATADGYSYMAILLHAPYEEGVNDDDYGTMVDAADLFRWALTKLELGIVADTSTPVCEQKVKLSWGKDNVLLVPKENLSAILPKGYEKKNIIIEYDTPESVDAPLEIDTVVGTATIYYKDDTMPQKQLITTVDLVPNEKVELSGILYVLNVIATIMQSYWFIVIIGLLIVILILYLIFTNIARKNSRKNRRVKNYRNL